MRSVLVAGLAVVAWSGAAAAQAPVYNADELTERPQLLSPSKTADLIRDASTGATGTVQIAFVIDEQGRVDPSSVKVVNATLASLGEAAKRVAPKLEFKPGKKDAKAVRTQVVLPLVFR